MSQSKMLVEHAMVPMQDHNLDDLVLDSGLSRLYDYAYI